MSAASSSERTGEALAGERPPARAGIAPARPVSIDLSQPSPMSHPDIRPVADSATHAHPHALAPEVLAPAQVVDEYLRVMVEALDLPTNLRDAIAYGLYGGGKRLRPLLAWWAAAAVTGKSGPRAGEASLPACAAVELVHAFSLVHDDLPAMDDDDLRRGRPTLHRATSEAMAILAGDAMLNLAYAHLAQSVTHPRLLATLVSELALGTSGMIAGQVYDTLGGFPPQMDAEHKLVTIHTNKTGALLRASCRMGALCAMAGEVNEQALGAITTYSEAIGLMFQIVDDIIDVTQPPEHAGKKTGKDIDAGKLTYPGVLGLEDSNARVENLRRVALESAASLGSAAQPLTQIAEYMAVRTK